MHLINSRKTPTNTRVVPAATTVPNAMAPTETQSTEAMSSTLLSEFGIVLRGKGTRGVWFLRKAFLGGLALTVGHGILLCDYSQLNVFRASRLSKSAMRLSCFAPCLFITLHTSTRPIIAFLRIVICSSVVMGVIPSSLEAC